MKIRSDQGDEEEDSKLLSSDDPSSLFERSTEIYRRAIKHFPNDGRLLSNYCQLCLDFNKNFHLVANILMKAEACDCSLDCQYLLYQQRIALTQNDAINNKDVNIFAYTRYIDVSHSFIQLLEN